MGSFMRSDRLLNGMHRVVRHDLPNEIVAVQGLLQLLALEEMDRLSAEGREYLRRVQNAASRVAELAQFLKEMEHLSSFTVQPSRLALAVLGRELQGILQQSFAHTRFEFDWHWHEPAVVGDARVILQAIQQLFAGLLDPPCDRCLVSASSRRQGEENIVLALRIKPAQPIALGATAPVFEHRREVVLARTWLALLNATAELTSAAGGEVQINLLIPN